MTESSGAAGVATRSTRAPLWSLIAFVVGAVAFSWIATAIQPGPGGLQSGALGLADIIVLGYAAALIVLVVDIVAMVRARRGSPGAPAAAMTATIGWFFVAGMLLFLMVGF
ncbi:hypothetical protein [Demequina sp. NBRC 110056]|uniref:hypothetical protein n=1 Tax=Demequina sp. NBRC 110056 TaxID=1570345 RepID=UPI00117EB0F7|nr:hypothetical protein [Demequina sp. NBRC 110056]